MKRRSFIPKILAAGISSVVPGYAFSGSVKPQNLSFPIDLDGDIFWEQIRAQYRTGDIINLNSAGVSPHPLSVEEAFFNYHRISNEAPSFTMWRQVDKKREELRIKLASVVSCLPEEVAINRNTTEALVTIIMNLPLKKGDEIVLSKFDYPRMVNAWKTRAEKEGIVLRWANPEEGKPSDDEIIKRYTSLFNAKTKVVHLTHMINWTGRIIPVQHIIAQSNKLGITSIVDAAHTFAHFPFKISDLGCDFLGASLHKWLSAPFGNGLLYIKKANIKKTKPFFPAEKNLGDKIQKFEELGTRNNASEMAIYEAIDFYEMIGAQRKYDRLVELRNYWIEKVKHHPKIKILTPLEPGRSGAIGVVEITGEDPSNFDRYLFEKHNIHCINIDHEGVVGIRITPNVFTTKAELDVLAKGLLEIANAT